MSQRQHWESVYASRAINELGWYAPHLETSLRWLADLDLAPDDPIIDVGCGASTLVDDLLDAGHRQVTLVDLSPTALKVVEERLQRRAADVSFIVADITSAGLPAKHFRLWHDRAVYHFLTSDEDCHRYKQQLLHALAPGGWLLIGVFSPEAPPRCSGLPVSRYDIAALQDAFGPEFSLQDDERVLHITPGGVEQLYQYALMQLDPNRSPP